MVPPVETPAAEETTVLESEPEPTAPLPTEHQPTAPLPTEHQPTAPLPTEHQPTAPLPTEHQPTAPLPTQHEPTESTIALPVEPEATTVLPVEPPTPEPVTPEQEPTPSEAAAAPSPRPGLLDEMPAETSSGRARKVLTGVGIGLVVLGAAYVGSVFYTADRTPPTASISGVEVGGMTSDEALTAVRDALDPRTTTAIPLTIGDVEATIQPEQAGLTYDPVASVAQVTGRSWDPRVLWERFTGTVDVPAVATVDNDALEGQLATAAEYVAVAPQDAVIVFADGRAVVTDPVDGAELDVPGAVDIISAEWLTAEGPLDLPIAVVTPDLDETDVETAMSDIVEPLLSAPVTIQAGEDQLPLEPLTLTQVSSLVGVDGEFALQVDPTKIAETLQAGLPDLGGEPKDATYQFVDGAPTIVPAVDGSGVDSEQLAQAVATAAVEPTGRVATAEFVTREPEFTTADAEALGPLQVVGEFSTPMPYDPPRTENLVIGTGKITGTIVMPGKEFSLLATIGPISSPPYNMSHGVDQGLVVDVAGGGLSQLSTTTFNAAYEAGMLDIEHRPHTRWFDRYPAGREATVNDPGLDMRWQNNTPYPILMQAGVADSRTWVKLWSIPYWDVEIVSGNKHNFTSSKTIYNTQPSCKPESGGTQGFSINVTRTVSREGVVDEAASGTLSWTYSAWPKVVCGPDPATLPQPTPTPEQPAGDQG